MNHIELNNEVTNMKDGFFQLEKDQEAIKVYIEAEVTPKYKKFNSYKERIETMIKESYYDDFLSKYSMETILDLHKYALSFNFEFKSYMAISKFYKDYALKSFDGNHYMEHYEDRVLAVALYLGKGNVDKAKGYVKTMMEQNYQPATPTFLNAGRAKRGEMVSCFLLDVDDSLNSIGFNINTSMQLSKMGGGVALNLSKVRGRGEEIKGFEGAASGVIPVMKLLEDAFSYANQLGQRKGAGAVYLSMFHWDIIEFLDTKKINVDEKIRMQSISIGVVVDQVFFDLAAKNEDLYVFAPYSVYKEYGKYFDDMNMDKMYYELLANPRVKKRKLDTNARDMLVNIAMKQLESGYPYLMYKTNANKNHALKDIGTVKMSNLCTEIFQLQETSEITDYEKKDIIKRDISCNLGSLNIVNVMENKAVRESVHVGIDALSVVSEETDIENAPSIKKANSELHSVGLGAMNLHGYLAKNKIPYDSKEALDFCDTFFMMLNFYSLEKSMQIAIEKKETFKDFGKSEYAKGTYFTKYIENDFAPVTDKVKVLFEGIYVPTPEDWNELKRQVQRHGLYNAYRLAIAPTQSISYIQNATASVMPIVNMIETRTYSNATTYYPMPYLSRETYWYYKDAYKMDQRKIIDLVSTIQEHVDQGVSAILYVDSETDTRQLAKLYIHGNKKGLKSLYYTRTKNLNAEECESCAV